MINIIPLSNLSDLWIVNQKGFNRDLHNIVDFAVKLALNNVPSLKKSRLIVNVSNYSEKRFRLFNSANSKCLYFIKPNDIWSNDEKFLGKIIISTNLLKKNPSFAIEDIYKVLISATLNLSQAYDTEDKIKIKENEVFGILGIKVI